MTQEEKDYVEFEQTQLRLIYESKLSGLAKHYKNSIELELHGLEDILEYTPENLRKSLQERIFRIRNILGGK